MGGNRYLLPLAAYSVLIFVISSIPGSDIPSSVSPYSSLFHFLLYFFYGIVAYLFFRNITTSIIFSTLYALSDEIHQYFVPGRSCDAMDLLVDIFGIVVGVILIYFVRKKLLEERS
jgi:VanZ family protein